jgi:outer membrane protein insertion porin family
MVVVFREVDAAKLSAVNFEGNRAIAAPVLETAIHALVVGEPYSERDLRQIVLLNLIPLYEEKGYLRASFPKITRVGGAAATVSALVAVDEGRCWQLGKVEFWGDQLPVEQMRKAGEFATGTVANWRLITASLEKAQRVLRADGYLQVRADPARIFQDGSGMVDLRVDVTKGKQFVFGTLKFEGVDPDAQDLMSRRWKLHEGTPLDEPYTDEYWSQIYQLVGHTVKKVEKRLVVRPGTTTIDVVYKIGG